MNAYRIPILLLALIAPSCLSLGCKEAPLKSTYDENSAAAKLTAEGRTIPVTAADEATGALFTFSNVNIQMKETEDGEILSMSADSDIHLKPLDWEVLFYKLDEIIHTERVQCRRGNFHDFVNLVALCDSAKLAEVPDRITLRLIRD
jgi:hypothetical protein